MATITPVTNIVNGFYPQFRTGSAQATTGQTDWFTVPSWARFAEIFLNLTANSGNTPVTTLSLVSTVPGTMTDTDLTTLFTGAAITAASQHRYNVGPGVTGIADGTDSTNADANVGVNIILPATFLGIKILNDRTTGDETYTYTVSLRFIRGK